MQWRVMVSFLIGCVLGAISLYLYLQTSGRLDPPAPGAGTQTPTRRSPLPAQPSGVAPPVAGVPAKPAITSTVIDPKPLVEPEAEPATITPMAIPVVGIEKNALRDHFNEKRGGRSHEAIDIMAPRGTAVLAAVDGTISRLFSSVPGGITIYQLDRGEKHIYYYAHLDRYSADLKEGKQILRGEVIGYVGTSGNAAENAPHLHFAIMRTENPKEWWKGVPINPHPLLMQHGVTYRAPAR